jgi:hypothetical protein
MTWLFSKALMDSVSLPFSLEPVAESSAATCLDGEPSAQWNVMPTPQGFWRNDKMMDASRLSRFGPTLRLLTESHGEAVLMSFLEGFPARTYQEPDQEQVLTEKGQACGLSSLESLAKYDHEESTWKTPQFSLLGDWELYSETWPRWGFMRNGECWARPMWALRICETESGLLPTPTATDYKGGRSPEAAEAAGRGANNNLRDFCRQVIGWKRPAPESLENLMGWPSQWTELKPLETGKFQQWRQEHLLEDETGEIAA